MVLDRGWDLDQAIGQLRRFTGEDLVFRTIPTGRIDLQTPVDGIAVEIDQDAVRELRGVGPGSRPRWTPAPRPVDGAPSASIAPATSPRPGAAPPRTAASASVRRTRPAADRPG